MSAEFLFGLSLALMAQQTSPQAPPPAGQEVELESITVEAVRTREAAAAFVDTIAASPAGARLARWDASLCVSVAGIRAPYGQAVVDRIAAEALAVGLEVGEPGCIPNVVVIATDDGQAVASALVENWRRRFRPPVDNSNMGLASLERFQTSEAPIRWWHIAVPVSVDTGELAARVAGGPPPQIASRNLSRTRAATRYDMTSVTVVIDLDRAEGTELPAMIDYTAMVILAQVDPRADYSGQPTVLNLFNDRENTTGLTSWDRSYLQALYSARPDRANAASQENEVVQRLARERLDRSRAEPEPEAPSTTPDTD